MKTTLNTVIRPTLLAAMIAASFSANAAVREVLGAGKGNAAANAQATVHERTGLSPAELKVRARQAYENGVTVTRFQQYHQGVPVWNEAVTEMRDAKGNASYHGAILRNLAQDLPGMAPITSKADALRNAQTHAQMFVTEPGSEQVTRYIRLGANGVADSFYLVSFVGQKNGGVSRPHYMINATTGAVESNWEGLTTANGTGPGGNTKTGKHEFGTTPKYGYLNVTQSGSNCTLDSPNVATYNFNGGTTLPASPHAFTCPRNTVKVINGAYSPLNDAHYFGNVVINMYKAYVGVAPLKFKLKMGVHYGKSVENAFWDGSRMTFGDGASTFYPLVALDLTSHEVSHGFTEQNAGFTYAGMPGALNESFSDMAGEAAEYYLKGSNDFLVASEVYKAAGAIRYMANPPLDGHSIDHQSKFTSSLGVHSGSGVYNKAFYTLARKTGWDTKKAFQVMADANRLYWTSTSSFDAAACGVQKSATARGYSAADVASAFAAVGVACR